MKRGILALGLALSLLLTACGGGAKATTMHLKRTEGMVGVSDDGGRDVTPREDLGLYSGYGVDTSAESYAWIDLDEVKLTKMDQDSEIAITKEGRKLEIEVKSGSLFFNVTQSLADDETMTIRTSSMMVGIRGTCGWVTQDAAALLEGTVEITAGEQSVAITAGEMAVITADGKIEVKSFTSAAIPEFIREELEEDEELKEQIKEASGIDPDAPAGARTYSHMRSTTYSNDGTPSSASETFYADDGLSFRNNNYDQIDGQLELIGYSESTLDEQGSLLESKYYVQDRLYSTYRLEEETADHRIYRSYNAEGQLLGQSAYYLDEQEQTARIENTGYNSDGTISYQQIDYPDEYGNAIRTESRFFDPNGFVTQDNRICDNTYDDQGRLIRKDDYAEDGTPYGYIVFEYE